ncbi:acyl-CoA dehydrogenase family protein [Nakamurella lactea]|uniref:acyl-CoA dehydrogenase family protein n=1 Tax=Nakamurella lactea TaxID=459515 RepID=UPI0003F7615E|nr:acyl-CoA dehydrogenase family protein [Nakamurella lactea]
MDLRLSDDEQAIASAFTDLFARESSRDRVRAAQSAGFDPALWSALVDIGLFDLAIPGPDGGGAFVDIVLVAEAAGRHLACAPIAETIVARRLLQRLGHDDVPAGAPMAFSPLPAQQGRLPMVPGGSVADLVLGLDGDTLVLVAGKSSGVEDFGFLAAADRSLDGGDRVVLAAGPPAAQAHAVAAAEWRLVTAAGCAGLALEALDVAGRYARDRHQFGVPIGSFQAVQERLATVAMAADGAQLLVREAAWCCDAGLPWEAAATVAYAYAAQTAIESVEAALHVHGGYGYTLDYDPQLFLRRAHGLRLAGGDPEAVWTQVGADRVNG